MSAMGSWSVVLGLGLTGLAPGNPLWDLLVNWDPEWPQRGGVTAVGYWQDQEYVVGEADIMLGVIDVPAAAIGRIENEVWQAGVKGDFWILPFWNVHAMIGQVEGTTTVTPAIPIFPVVEVDYDGIVYGAGTTLAYGQDWWWFSVTGVVTETELEGEASAVKAWLVTPKVGVRTERWEAWLGATYQNVDERQKGVFNVPDLGVAVYDIQLEGAEEWNLQIGLRCRVWESLFVTLEGGLGERTSALVQAEWRIW